MSMDVYQRRCRRLLRIAYPRRFRAEREDELLGVLLDLAEPGSDRLRRSVLFDVLVSGLWYRLRDRPPPLRWLGYRLLDLKVPSLYRPWVYDDITGRLWPFRRLLALTVMTAALLALVHGFVSVAGIGRPEVFQIEFLLGWLVGGTPMSYLIRVRLRRNALARHGLDPDQMPVAGKAWQPPPGFVFGRAPRDQVWPALVIPGGTALAGAAATAAVLLVRVPDAVVRIVFSGLISVGLGALIALLVRVRLARRLAIRPPDPDRPAVRWRRWAVALVVAAAAGFTGAQVAGVALRPEPDLVPLVPVMLTLLLAPPVLVAGLVARSAERRTGLVVTTREVALGVFDDGDAIPSERAVSTPFPPPPAAG